MAETASLPIRRPSADLCSERASALALVPRRQALWVTGQVVGAQVATVLDAWSTQPELAVALSLGFGASAVNLRRLWAAPLVLGSVVSTAMPFLWLGLPSIVGAGFVAGGAATLLLPHRTDMLDTLNGALAGLAGASIGLWAATTFIPLGLSVPFLATVTVALVGLLASLSLVPSAVRFDRKTRPPTRRMVRQTLLQQYRPPVLHALGLYSEIRQRAPSGPMRQGLAEVTTWVWRLQVTLQSLDRDLESINVEDISSRISECSLEDEPDAFTRERRQATAEHLRRLLTHRDAIALERGRTEAAVQYATAYLEEARAGLVIAQTLPGEHAPQRLSEVLTQLRTHAEDGTARRRTAREVDAL